MNQLVGHAVERQSSVPIVDGIRYLVKPNDAWYHPACDATTNGQTESKADGFWVTPTLSPYIPMVFDLPNPAYWNILLHLQHAKG